MLVGFRRNLYRLMAASSLGSLAPELHNLLKGPESDPQTGSRITEMVRGLKVIEDYARASLPCWQRLLGLYHHETRHEKIPYTSLITPLRPRHWAPVMVRTGSRVNTLIGLRCWVFEAKSTDFCCESHRWEAQGAVIHEYSPDSKFQEDNFGHRLQPN